MVCVNVRRPIRRHCQYNFCNGEHQCILIQNKKKLSMPKPSEFMLLALANTTQKMMSIENIKPQQEKKTRSTNTLQRKTQNLLRNLRNGLSNWQLKDLKQDENLKFVKNFNEIVKILLKEFQNCQKKTQP